MKQLTLCESFLIIIRAMDLRYGWKEEEENGGEMRRYSKTFLLIPTVLFKSRYLWFRFRRRGFTLRWYPRIIGTSLDNISKVKHNYSHCWFPQCRNNYQVGNYVNKCTKQLCRYVWQCTRYNGLPNAVKFCTRHDTEQNRHQFLKKKPAW